MDPFIQKLTTQLHNRLNSSKTLTDPLERLIAVTKNTDDAIAELRIFVRDYAFNSHEEIEYFKIIKPKILSHRVEEGLRYQLILNKPIGTREIQIKYFEKELKSLQGFFRMNAFLYQYYKNRFSELDSLFFLRNSGPLMVPVVDMMAENATEFSTPVSYIFTKFIAYEHAQYFILEQIAGLQNESKPIINSEMSTGLKWTGDVVNIVELAYGIWLTGQLNHGNASLSQIVRWLEADLQINIGIAQRRFTEIQNRKRLSQTRYIDLMRDQILQKIANENA